jgi:hypothetical protein
MAMRLNPTFAAFACGIAAVVGAHVVMVTLVAQGSTDDVVDVCVTAENAMRLTGTDAECGPGERRVRLKEPPVEKICEQKPADVEGLRRRLEQLEGRSAERLENQSTIAPFKVVNEAGITVFSVEEATQAPTPAAVEIFNDVGTRVAVLAANAEGGAVTVESTARRGVSVGVPVSAVSATLSAYGEYLGADVRVGSSRRLSLGRGADGRYAFRVLSLAGKMVAEVGESDECSGIVSVFDAAGNKRVRLDCESAQGSGMVAVSNVDGLDVAMLSARAAGSSGLLQLTNGSGTVMVEAGVLATGIGAVRAGPGGFQHGLGFLGLPASYIEGKP